MDWQTVISTVVGTFVGVLAGWMISHFYAQRSSQELKREAESLRHLTTLILRGLEEAGFVEFSRDEQGGLIGIAFKRPVSDVLGVGDGAEVKLETEIEDRPTPEEPRT